MQNKDIKNTDLWVQTGFAIRIPDMLRILVTFQTTLHEDALLYLEEGK